MEKVIAGLDREIDRKLKDYHREFELLKIVLGVKEQGVASVIAETGADMDRFPSEGHLSTWAGMGPGNSESAGKKWKDDPRQTVFPSRNASIAS
ncbi:MAG: IS110 family transposase [Proteobacteria bacterium]|nr:IS110 family transposase [Pseudomonadota bacterium]MBU2228136.1 IS110 family transposase [Pseudomonadota bacterium]MBU2262457.1 IS110 family transposase [Pseudomonadota bacterium]